MKVLMFGWEFPPHIAGGLGTACYGLTKGLAHHNIEVLFVMPKASNDEDQSFVQIINASSVDVDPRNAHLSIFENQVSFIEVNSQLVPYIGINEYYKIVDQLESGVIEDVTTGEKRRYDLQSL